ncbi:MAG: AAA family ATPase [Thermomicrobiales bacterium]
MPHGARLKSISSNGVTFVDGNGYEMPVENLSDGYRSILSMTFDLIRQLQRAYRLEQIFAPENPTVVSAPGVVLIDEVDAHLHPSWQRRIGTWFRQHFPRMQFIVTTHSPFVCQAAEVGTVWRLPRPGSDEECKQIVGAELHRLIYGNILEAYSTSAFDMQATRPESSQRQLQRLADLNLKEIDEGLSAAEEEEQVRLRAAFPLRAGALP